MNEIRKRPNHRPNKPLTTTEKLQDQFYTINETAELLKVHPNTIRKAIREQRLNAIHLGSKWLIKKQDIESL